MPKIIETGFVKADARNLPEVTADMMMGFFKSDKFMSPEMKNVKTVRCTRVAYRDAAIGYVRAKRDGPKVHVIADVTPEHSVKAKGYKVHCFINTEKKQILDAFCDDCAASKGGCKHAVVFLAWLHKQSEEPSVTDKACYWKKSKLSESASLEVMTIEQVSPHTYPDVEDEAVAAFFHESVAELSVIQSQAILLRHVDEQQSLSIFHLMTAFKRQDGLRNATDFINFCKFHMTEGDCKVASVLTVDQASSSLWFALRQGRVSASKLHEASACKTSDGCLVRCIKGATKVKDTDAMKRGRELESKVLKKVGQTLKKKCSVTGIVLSPNDPVFGASPDGLTGDAVIEIKCPTTDDRFKTYFNKNQTEPSPRYKAQINLQMLMCGKMVGYFCVADPNFDDNKEVKILVVTYDETYTLSVMKKALAFWVEYIFPDLYDNN